MWWKWLLQVIAFAAVVLLTYNVLKIYVLPKLKINKWIVLTLGIVTFLLPSIIAAVSGNTLQENSWVMLATSGLFMLFFLWFADLSGLNRSAKAGKNNSKTPVTTFARKKDKKDVVIKPKAKPNRAKNKNS